MDHLFISSFFIAGIILYLFINDLKKNKNKFYNEINNEVWIKLYALLTIGIIHFIWLFAILFLNYDDNTLIYGFPFYLLIPYIIYGGINYAGETTLHIVGLESNKESIASEKINKYLNYLISLYFILIIIFLIIPVECKKDIFKYIIKVLHDVGKLCF